MLHSAIAAAPPPPSAAHFPDAMLPASSADSAGRPARLAELCAPGLVILADLPALQAAVKLRAAADGTTASSAIDVSRLVHLIATASFSIPARTVCAAHIITSNTSTMPNTTSAISLSYLQPSGFGSGRPSSNTHALIRLIARETEGAFLLATAHTRVLAVVSADVAVVDAVRAARLAGIAVELWHCAAPPAWSAALRAVDAQQNAAALDVHDMASYWRYLSDCATAVAHPTTDLPTASVKSPIPSPLPLAFPEEKPILPLALPLVARVRPRFAGSVSPKRPVVLRAARPTVTTAAAAADVAKVRPRFVGSVSPKRPVVPKAARPAAAAAAADSTPPLARPWGRPPTEDTIRTGGEVRAVIAARAAVAAVRGNSETSVSISVSRSSSEDDNNSVSVGDTGTFVRANGRGGGLSGRERRGGRHNIPMATLRTPSPRRDGGSGCGASWPPVRGAWSGGRCSRREFCLDARCSGRHTVKELAFMEQRGEKDKVSVGKQKRCAGGWRCANNMRRTGVCSFLHDDELPFCAACLGRHKKVPCDEERSRTVDEDDIADLIRDGCLARIHNN